MATVQDKLFNNGVQVKRCSMCKQFLAVEHFWNNRWNNDGLTEACKPCLTTHRKKIKAEKGKEGIRAENERRYANLPALKKCARCGSLLDKSQFVAQTFFIYSYCPTCRQKDCDRNKPRIRILQRAKYRADPSKHRQSAREFAATRRWQALTRYGGNPPKCACCGEKEAAFLGIDHIEGGGNQHRREIGVNSGSQFYTWLRKNNYPKGFRVLCMNCNFAFGRYGQCPHATLPAVPRHCAPRTVAP